MIENKILKGSIMKILRKLLLDPWLNMIDLDAYFDRSEHMRQLHASGRYLGTSKIGEWNQSEEKRERMQRIREKNSLDKNARGYGSEYHMRLANRTLLHNKFQGKEGYLYFLQFPGSIKVGFSKNWERRVTKQIMGGEIIAIVSGRTDDLADLEFDTFITFQEYTQVSEDGTRYTEYLDKKIKNQVYQFIKNRVQETKGLRFIVQN